MTINNFGALVLTQNQGEFVVQKKTLEMKLHVCVLVVYTELGNKELLLSCNVEMKADEYRTGGFSKFVACCSSCKFEKLLPLALVIAGGDDATGVEVVLFVVALVI